MCSKRDEHGFADTLANTIYSKEIIWTYRLTSKTLIKSFQVQPILSIFIKDNINGMMSQSHAPRRAFPHHGGGKKWYETVEDMQKDPEA